MSDVTHVMSQCNSNEDVNGRLNEADHKRLKRPTTDAGLGRKYRRTKVYPKTSGKVFILRYDL